MKPLIAIVGRPNVGKSTLFNRLSDTKKAIVIDEPGATRDRNYGESDWNGRYFRVVDTGGFEPLSKEQLLEQMRLQATMAIEEADAVIFIMDGGSGVTPADEEIASLLRRAEKPVFYVVNKIDNQKQEPKALDFYRLGVDMIYTISAQHGLGVGDLMDDVVKALPETEEEEEEGERIRVAVIGRPNVGKSSLVNALLGYERTIVDTTPGTTRDPIDTPFEVGGRKYTLIDTAGIRKKNRVSRRVENYSVVGVLKTLERCDVALLIVDAEQGVTEQDAKIAGLAYERGAAVVIVINKWDLLEKDNSTFGRYVSHVRENLKYLGFAPIITVSALTGQRVSKIFEIIENVYDRYTRRVTTSVLNKSLETFMKQVPPPRYRGKANTIAYATQAGVKPPTFVIFAREPKAIHFSYERFLTNRIREDLGFDQVPIRLIFRKKGGKE